ncbi:MAG: MMPL family transporter [Solirubrobacteraceae bacterium]
MTYTPPHTPAPAPPPPSGPLARLVRAAARGASRRPKLTVALWIGLIVACIALGSLSGTRNLSDAASNVGQSAQAQARLLTAGIEDPASEDVLVRSTSAERTASAVAALTARARALPSVRSVENAGTTPSLSRAGGRTQLVVVTLRGDPDDADSRVVPLEHAVAGLVSRTPGVRFLESGDGSGERAVNQVVDEGLHRAELISVPLTLVILVLAFGAVVAASVPLLLGVTSVAAALGALGLVSQISPEGSSTAPVVVLIGLAVGVDYSLFYIRRERGERAAGGGPHAALDATSATVGRAIVVAGMTVAIGLAGLLFTGVGVFTSMALGAILVVVIAVIGSLTVLPAVLALLGERVDRGRLRRRRTRRSAAITAWGRLAELVTGHARVSLAIVVVVLAGLAAPILSMHTLAPGVDDMPANTPVVVAYRAIERAFPGSSDIAELVVSGHQLGRTNAQQRLVELGRAGERIAGGRGAVSLRLAAGGETALVAFPVANGSLATERRNVEALRRRLEPMTSRLLGPARAELTGDDAENLDFTDRMSTATPLVIVFVLALAFVLLVATFRSPLLALSVMGLNLLSVGAAFGVLVAVFQHTWAQSLLGFTSDGAITNWLPLFAFVVLFGLSMDYTVLVLERASEARRAGAGAREAAAEALGSTGSTVTSAAIVMIAVFSVFATIPLLEFKQLGVGLAAAVALDATLVRGVALPAVLTLLGDRGLRPAPLPRSERTRDWDHVSHVGALEAIHD